RSSTGGRVKRLAGSRQRRNSLSSWKNRQQQVLRPLHETARLTRRRGRLGSHTSEAAARAEFLGVCAAGLGAMMPIGAEKCYNVLHGKGRHQGAPSERNRCVTSRRGGRNR